MRHVIAIGPPMDRSCGEQYTHEPNPSLMGNRPVARGSTQLRKPKIAEGLAFREPMAGQGFNDQFPWR